MEQISTIDALIDLWPSRVALAQDIEVPSARVHKWATGQSIPARYHAAVLRSASSRGIRITAADLVRLHDKQEAA